jgi:shikimate dehydrogenase
MRLFGLIGFPLTHSFSKKYFTEKFEAENLKDCRYENFQIESIEELPKIISANTSLEGLNVTIPHKESVLKFLHEKNDLVEQVGACNCIKIENGKLKGFNTDVIAFEKSLEKKLKPHHRRAYILGTGGAAKAIEFVLIELGIEYQFVSRNPSAGQITYEELDDESIESHQLIINTTPVGMYPNISEAPPIPYDSLTPEHFLFDLTYNPEKTLFLQNGEAKGAAIENGYDMLVRQAEESWLIWNRQ